MTKMGSPYLESGESLILTTDRVSVNTVQYDMLLTTRYLILVDARYAQFQPQMIPLLTIQSVKGGKTANGELVITLFFTETGSSGKSESMVLLFSQQPGEQRKRERDDWLKTLMGLIVSVRQESSYESIATADPEIGIRPSKRRQISPDIPHPYTKVVETRPAQIELIIIPDEPESPVFSEEIQELPEIYFPGEETQSEVTPAPCATVETPGDSQEMTESPDAITPPFPVLEETISASQEVAESPDAITPPFPVLEETISASQEVAESPDTILPSLHGIEGTAVDSPEASGSAFEEIPGSPEADSGEQKRVSVSLLAAVKSLISPKERTGLPDSVLTPLPGLEETRVAASEMTGSPFPLLPPEVPGIVASPYTQEEKAESILPHETSTIEEKPGASQEDTGYPDLPNSPDPVTVESTAVLGQDSQLAEQVSFEAGNGDESVQQPSPGENPPAPGSPQLSAGPGSRLLTFIAVAAIILIILGIAGVVVFYPQNLTAPRVEPTPLPTQTIQQTLQPTLVIPLPTAVIIPTTGVWVRVDYPRSYYGLVGNSGSMRGVTGSGDQVYKIYESEGIVQAQVQKTDNTGDTLTVEIYRDGKVIGNRSVSIPRGSVELLIDAKTGNPPAMTPVVTPSSNQTGSNVGRIMYF
jgi:hypothetical protein